MNHTKEIHFDDIPLTTEEDQLIPTSTQTSTPTSTQTRVKCCKHWLYKIFNIYNNCFIHFGIPVMSLLLLVTIPIFVAAIISENIPGIVCSTIILFIIIMYFTGCFMYYSFNYENYQEI